MANGAQRPKSSEKRRGFFIQIRGKFQPEDQESEYDLNKLQKGYTQPQPVQANNSRDPNKNLIPKPASSTVCKNKLSHTSSETSGEGMIQSRDEAKSPSRKNPCGSWPWSAWMRLLPGTHCILEVLGVQHFNIPQASDRLAFLPRQFGLDEIVPRLSWKRNIKGQMSLA